MGSLIWTRLGDRDAWEATHGTDVWTITRHSSRWAVLRNNMILGPRPRTIEDAERVVLTTILAEESARSARRVG